MSSVSLIVQNFSAITCLSNNCITIYFLIIDVGDVLKFVEDENKKIGGGDAAVAESRNGSIRH